MTDKVYLLIKEDKSKIKENILGVYTSKREAMLARERLYEYYHFSKKSYQPELLKLDLNSTVDTADNVILNFQLAFDNEMNLVIINESTKYSESSDTWLNQWGYSNPKNDIEVNEVQFKYNRSMGNDDQFAISAICKINTSIMESESEIFAKGRELVYNEFKKRFSDLKEMANHVFISIYPRYNFIEDKIDLLDIRVDDYFKETYTDEAVTMFREILHNYKEMVLRHIIFSNTFMEIENKANKSKNADVIQQAREEAEKILNNFTWYKENPSLVVGLKTFMIKGPKMFQLTLYYSNIIKEKKG